MVTCGLGAVVLCLLLGGSRDQFPAHSTFQLLFNLRALALIFVMVGLWTHLRGPTRAMLSQGMISVLNTLGVCFFSFFARLKP
jgi:hypothetical protein